MLTFRSWSERDGNQERVDKAPEHDIFSWCLGHFFSSWIPLVLCLIYATLSGSVSSNMDFMFLKQFIVNSSIFRTNISSYWITTHSIFSLYFFCSPPPKTYLHFFFLLNCSSLHSASVIFFSPLFLFPTLFYILFIMLFLSLFYCFLLKIDSMMDGCSLSLC